MTENIIIASNERLHVAVPGHGKSVYLRIGSPLLTNGAEVSLDEARAAFEALGQAIGTAIAILDELAPVIAEPDEEPADV